MFLRVLGSFFLCCLFFDLSAQTLLGAGDLALLAFHSDGNEGNWSEDGLAFVNLVPLDSGTQLQITDNAYLGQSFCANEGELTWQYLGASPLAPGTVVVIDGTQASVGQLLQNSPLALSTQGDQIHLYQNKRLITALSNQAWLAQCPTNCIGQTGSTCLDPLLQGFSLDLSGQGSAGENAYYNGPSQVSVDTLFSVLYDLNNWQQADTALPKAFPLNLQLQRPSIAEPTGLTAQVDSNALRLKVQANAQNHSVLVAFSKSHHFPRPAGAYRRSDPLGSRAEIHYLGGADSLPPIAGLEPGQTYYIKVWSVNAQYEYSLGKVYRFNTASSFNPGDLLFTAYCSRGEDAFGLILFKDVPAGNKLYFSDEEWDGQAFGSGEGDLIWQIDSFLSAGTEVLFWGDSTGQWHSSTGQLDAGSLGPPNLAGSNEAFYCYWGEERQPQVFIAAIANAFYDDGSRVGSLVQTGLTPGAEAFFTASNEDIFRYQGPYGTLPLLQLRDSVQDAAHWAKENGTGTESNGRFPDLPFQLRNLDPLALIYNGAWNFDPRQYAHAQQAIHILSDTLHWSGYLEGLDLLVDSAAALVLLDSAQVRLTRHLTVKGALLIHAPAELQQWGSGAQVKGRGSFQLSQYYQAQDHRRYSFYASMLVDQHAVGLFPHANPNDFYSWSATTQRFLRQAPQDTLILGKGYLSTPPVQNDPAALVRDTIQFRGTIQDLGQGNLSLTYQNLKAGDYLLLGNPYPCSLDAAQFLALNPILDQVLYLWDHRSDTDAQGNNRTSDYSIWTPVGALSPNGGRLSNGRVAAGQAFMVRLHRDLPQGSIQFMNRMCSPGKEQGHFFKNADSPFWLLTLRGPNKQSASLLLVEEARNYLGYDRLGDAVLNSAAELQLASQVDNYRLSIDARPRFQRADLYLEIPATGDYQLFWQPGSAAPAKTLYLIDHQSGRLYPWQDTLNLQLTEGSYSKRFSCLWLVPGALSLKEVEAPLCWWDGRFLRSTVITDLEELRIYDLNGALLLDRGHLELPWESPGFAPGFYLLHYRRDGHWHREIIYHQI